MSVFLPQLPGAGMQPQGTMSSSAELLGKSLLIVSLLELIGFTIESSPVHVTLATQETEAKGFEFKACLNHTVSPPHFPQMKIKSDDA